MIISGGINVYPAEIEAALEACPSIYEAAVFGIPSEEWGESVHAVVVVAPGAELDANGVMAYAREHLAGYKVPRSVSFLDETRRRCRRARSSSASCASPSGRDTRPAYEEAMRPIACGATGAHDGRGRVGRGPVETTGGARSL